MKWAGILYADTNLGKLKFTLMIISYAWWKMGEDLEIMGLLNQVYLTNDLMNWTDLLNNFFVLIVMEWFLVWPLIYSVSLTFILYWFFLVTKFYSQISEKHKPPSLRKGSYKISSVHLSVYLPVTHFSQDLLSECS